MQESFLDTPSLGYVLGWWASQDGAGARSWVSQQVADHRSLVKILEGFLQKEVRTEPNGPESTRLSLDVQGLSAFIDPADIIETCRSLLRTRPPWLTERGRATLQRLVRHSLVAAATDR